MTQRDGERLIATMVEAAEALTRVDAESLANSYSDLSAEIADHYWTAWRAKVGRFHDNELSRAMIVIHGKVHDRAVDVEGEAVLVPDENDREDGVNLAEPWWTALRALSNATLGYYAKSELKTWEYETLILPWRLTFGGDPK